MPSFWTLFLRMIAALALIAPMVWITVRLYARRGTLSVHGKRLEVIESLSMGPQKSIVAVRVVDQVLVIGVSPKDMQLLAQLTQAEWNKSSNRPSVPAEEGSAR